MATGQEQTPMARWLRGTTYVPGDEGGWRRLTWDEAEARASEVRRLDREAGEDVEKKEAALAASMAADAAERWCEGCEERFPADQLSACDDVMLCDECRHEWEEVFYP